ncbi:hypothetical protein ScalyP_jg4135 [Parmales sp. scaly parma]|nr:hypothetical protein ScalyP_jg4135 [Parmales sp. scaly parma]
MSHFLTLKEPIINKENQKVEQKDNTVKFAKTEVSSQTEIRFRDSQRAKENDHSTLAHAHGLSTNLQATKKAAKKAECTVTRAMLTDFSSAKQTIKTNIQKVEQKEVSSRYETEIRFRDSQRAKALEQKKLELRRKKEEVEETRRVRNLAEQATKNEVAERVEKNRLDLEVEEKARKEKILQRKVEIRERAQRLKNEKLAKERLAQQERREVKRLRKDSLECENRVKAEVEVKEKLKKKVWNDVGKIPKNTSLLDI